MIPVPYLYFNGTCEEAMTTYAQIFGGQITAMMRMSDAPASENIPADVADMIMHCLLVLPGGAQIMASDNFQGTSAETSNVALTIPFDDLASARAAFEALREGADIQQDFGPQFWTEGFGALKDRFHIRWQISAPNTSF